MDLLFAKAFFMKFCLCCIGLTFIAEDSQQVIVSALLLLHGNRSRYEMVCFVLSYYNEYVGIWVVNEKCFITLTNQCSRNAISPPKITNVKQNSTAHKDPTVLRRKPKNQLQKTVLLPLIKSRIPATEPGDHP